MQFFGPKNGLFAAVMAVPAIVPRLDSAFDGPRRNLGERVVRAYLVRWEGHPGREPLMAMLRGAIVNERAAAQLRDYIQSRLLDGMAGRGDDAALRAGLAASMLIGIVVGRRIVELPILASADNETLVALIAPAIQTVLTAVEE